MYRCTPNETTFTFMPCLNLGSKGYNCFCKVITTRLASNSLRFDGRTYKRALS